MPLAPHLEAAEVQASASRCGITVACVRGDTHDLLGTGDFGILCSGTVTLEAALAGLPMLIFYRGSWLNAIVAKLLVEIDRIGLPNIVLGGPQPVFPERIQHRARAAALAEETLRILENPNELAVLRDATHRVREQLSGGATSRAVAKEALALAGVR